MKPIYLYRESDEQEPVPVRVDRFPDPARSVITLAQYTGDFVGTIVVEASIESDPQETDWFVAHTEVYLPFESSEEKSRNRSTNLVGRFIWMRVSITRDPNKPVGGVDRITVI